jgi:S-(hydroxymethyl)glutathione dehydrogenase/alcohol dehydrogenase
MKTAVFHKPGDIRYDTVEYPRTEQDADVILKMISTAICGSDLHIMSSSVPQTHLQIKKGDRVVVPFPISCGHCFFCA